MTSPDNTNHADALRSKRNRLEYLLGYAKPPLFAEFGCGSGFVTGIVAERFGRSWIIGMDRDARRLQSLKKIQGASAVHCEIGSACLRDKCADTVLIVSTIHEIYAQSGRGGVDKVLGDAADILKDGGRLILYDRVRPDSQRATIDFVDPELRNRFERFAEDFRMRRIDYVEEGSRILLDNADAFEFIERFALETGDDWDMSLDETDYFFTREQYEAACSRAGMEIYHRIVWEEASGMPEPLANKMIIDTEFRRSWIGLVAVKAGTVHPDESI